MYGNRSMIRTPFAGGVPFVPRWEALPSGYGEGCDCGCGGDCDGGDGSQARRGRPGSGARSPGESGGLTGAFDGSAGIGGDLGAPTYAGSGGPLAVLDTPPLKPIGDGTGGKGGGGGSGGGGTPEDVAETEAHNDFLLGLGDAVAQGGDAAMDFAVDYLGDDLAVDAPVYVEPYPEGWCPVWDANTCGEMPTWVADYHPSDLTVELRPLVLASLQGDWTTCEQDVMIAAWDLLVRNFDLVQWALCTATGDTNAGSCIQEYLFGLRSVVLQKHDCDGLARGYPFADLLEVAIDVALSGLAFSLAFVDDRPELWWCVGDDGSHDYMLERGAELFCSEFVNDRDCGVVSVASTLLHELTHICFRNVEGDSYLECDSAYLVTNYFLWAARARFAGVSSALCCGGMRVPGVDDMSGDWQPGNGYPISFPNNDPVHGCLGKYQPVQHHVFNVIEVSNAAPEHSIVQAG